MLFWIFFDQSNVYEETWVKNWITYVNNQATILYYTHFWLHYFNILSPLSTTQISSQPQNKMLNFVVFCFSILNSDIHSSEGRGLRSTFQLQNLLYLMYKKTHVCSSFFHFSFRATLYLMNVLVYLDIDQGIHKVKI